MVVVVGLLLLCSCAVSTSQQHAREVALTYYNERPGNERVGEISEHVVDMEENGYVFLLDDKSLLGKAISGDLKMIGFQGVLINFLHYNMCQELGRTWESNNRMRKSLVETYGDKFKPELFDTPKVAYYYWCQNKQFSTMQHSWMYLNSSVFGKTTFDELTVEDLKRFFTEVKNQRYYTVKVRYLGTAKVPFPPLGWGYVNYFDCIEMTPLKSENKMGEVAHNKGRGDGGRDVVDQVD